VTRARARAAICAAALCAPLPALAQTAPPPHAGSYPDRPPSGGSLPRPAPAPEDPGHIHEGFYLRLGLGIGWLRTASSFEGTVAGRPASEAIGELTYAGHGLAVDAGIGGSIAPGIVLGYGFAWQIADDPTLQVENTLGSDGETEQRDPLGAWIHGLLIDVFPDPRGNLEFGALLGVGIVGTGDADESSTGIAGQIWGGYGIWAAKQASLVALLRLSIARTTSESTTSVVSGNAGPPTLIDRADTTFTVGVVTGLLVQ
jgi:hypothetical protein